jgi:chaperone BCS1
LTRARLKREQVLPEVVFISRPPTTGAMASYLPLVQQLLSGFNTQLNTAVNVSESASATAAAAATASATPLGMPTDLSGLFALLLSFSALRDWMKLAILGGLLEFFRRFAYMGYNKLVASFFIRAVFEDQDSSYGGSLHQ